MRKFKKRQLIHQQLETNKENKMNKEAPKVSTPAKPYNPGGPAVAVGTNPGKKPAPVNPGGAV